jgi:hypothetical protein
MKEKSTEAARSNFITTVGEPKATAKKSSYCQKNNIKVIVKELL